MGVSVFSQVWKASDVYSLRAMFPRGGKGKPGLALRASPL